MARRIVLSARAAKTPATHSQAVKAAGLVFVSGTGPFDPLTGVITGATIQEQTRQCLANIEAILVEAGRFGEQDCECDVRARGGRGLCRDERRVGAMVSGRSTGSARGEDADQGSGIQGFDCGDRRGLGWVFGVAVFDEGAGAEEVEREGCAASGFEGDAEWEALPVGGGADGDEVVGLGPGGDLL